MSKCCQKNDDIKVESLTLDDGRRAERHVSLNDQGNQVVEIFAEEKRPLKLEKRIVREMKQIVAKETHEVVRDGEVIASEVHSVAPDVPLQLRQKIGLVDHAKVVDGDYVRKEEVGQIVADGVVAGVTALMQSQPQSMGMVKSSRQIVEQNVEEKKGGNWVAIGIMGVVLLVQVAVICWLFLA